MLLRFGGVVVIASLLMPGNARADCAQEISRLMSKDTEKLTTRHNRLSKQIKEKGEQTKLVAEQCRIARALMPRLEEQIAAIKQSGCAKDPQSGPMIADIIRGHEDDLQMAVRTINRPDCR